MGLWRSESIADLVPRRAQALVSNALAETRVILVNGAPRAGSTLTPLATADIAGWIVPLQDEPTGFVGRDGLMVSEEIQLAPRCCGRSNSESISIPPYNYKRRIRLRQHAQPRPRCLDLVRLTPEVRKCHGVRTADGLSSPQNRGGPVPLGAHVRRTSVNAAALRNFGSLSTFALLDPLVAQVSAGSAVDLACCLVRAMSQESPREARRCRMTWLNAGCIEGQPVQKSAKVEGHSGVQDLNQCPHIAVDISVTPLSCPAASCRPGEGWGFRARWWAELPTLRPDDDRERD
jgi:hypothetical protein